jgi:DNA polymerase-1
MVVNTPIQGSAADIVKVAMLRVDRALSEERLASRMILQVHDELVLEAPEAEAERAEALVRRAMEGAASLRVPLVVEAGRASSWAGAH